MEHRAWPYAAGIVDSEGCICISKGHSTSCTKAQTRVTVGIGNTDVRLMHWLVENFGGVYIKRPNNRGYSASGGCGYIYGWQIPFSKKEWFITGISPYLVLKVSQSYLALKYLALGRGWHVDERIALSKECQDLNQQAPDDLYLGSFASAQERAAYAAGMLDGDGALYMGMADLSPRIGITSKSLRVVRWFYRNFGGRILFPSSNVRPYYGWHLSGRRNKELFLLKVMPYLRLKLEQAKILMRVLDITGKHHLVEDRKSFAKQLRALNNMRESVTTETQEGLPPKIQSELTGNRESIPTGT